MDSNAIVSGMVEQLINSVADAVVAKITPVVPPVVLNDRVSALADRLETAEKAIVEHLNDLEKLSKRLDTLEKNPVTDDDVRDIVNEELPDMDEYVKTEDVDSAVEQAMPDMDEYVKRDDIADAVADGIAEHDVSAEVEKLTDQVKKLDEAIVDLRSLFGAIENAIASSQRGE